MTAERRNLFILGGVLTVFLLGVIVPEFRRGAASLAHPDPVGPTAYSKSAIGHLAFYRLLDDLDIPAVISEDGAGRHVGSDDVLVIAEPRTDSATLENVKIMLEAPTVLLVLPKRTGEPDRQQPNWLGENKLVSEGSARSVLRLVDTGATVARHGSLAHLSGKMELPGVPSIVNPQLIRSSKIQPLLASPDGILMGRMDTGTGVVFVLSDPDVIANFGLNRGDNSVLAVGLLDWIRRGHRAGDVIFDEFEHGFTEKPLHLLGILFQFPFILVTAQMALAIVLLAWAATARFGPAVLLEPAIEAGKRSLIDNGARLMTQSGRSGDLSQRYFEEMVRDTGLRLHAPAALDFQALIAWLERTPGAPPAPAAAAPQQIWTWRKELLGESRRNP